MKVDLLAFSALVLVASVGGSPFVPTVTLPSRYSSPKVPNSPCPLVTLKDNCFGQKSTCWSPGKEDSDCPQNGHCCFNGCVNVCMDQPMEIPPSIPAKPDCSVQYVEQEEVAEMEDCSEVPEAQTCVTTTSQECHQECSLVDKPETVTVLEECCTTDKELVCELNPDGCQDGSTDADFTETSCNQQEEACYNVPEQVCHVEEVPDCWPVENQECKKVKKPVEWPTVRQKCATTYKEECQMVDKVICDQKEEWHSDFSFDDIMKRLGSSRGQSGCSKRRVKQCTQKPTENCEEIQSVTLEYEDAEECHTVTTQKCVTKKINKCEMSTRRQCLPASNICQNPRSSLRRVPVKADCTLPDKICRFVDKVSCKTNERSEARWVPAKVCEKVCKPVTTRNCTPRKLRQQCTKFNQRMFYDVPVQRCSAN